MIPAFILIGGTFALCALRWAGRHRCRPCGIEFASRAALAKHRKYYTHD